MDGNYSRKLINRKFENYFAQAYNGCCLACRNRSKSIPILVCVYVIQFYPSTTTSGNHERFKAISDVLSFSFLDHDFRTVSEHVCRSNQVYLYLLRDVITTKRSEQGPKKRF